MLGGCPFAEKIHKIVLDLDDIIYLDFFISDLIKLVWIKIPSKTLLKKEWIITHALHVNYLYRVKSPSPTEKSRADVCLRAHVDDEDPLTRVGLRIVGGEVVGQRRLSDTTLGRIFLLHTWWQHCDWTLQGIAKSVHCNSMSVISFLFMSSWLEFLDAMNLFCI